MILVNRRIILLTSAVADFGLDVGTVLKATRARHG